MTLKFFDNTKVSTHRECPRKYFFAHVLHLSGEGNAPALAFGLAWHKAMDSLWSDLAIGGMDDDKQVLRSAFGAFLKEWTSQGFHGLDEWTDEDWEALAPRTPHTALGMLEGYIEKMSGFILNNCELLAVEMPFAVPIFAGDTNVWYCGRQDKVVRYQNGVWVVDHKTTTEYKKEGYFRSSFADSFSPNSQMEGYAFGATIKYGKDFHGVLIDAALVHKTVFEGFRILPIIGGEESLDQWLWETQHEIKRIEAFEEEVNSLTHSDKLNNLNYLPAFPRNTRSCFNFGRACTFLDLCKGWENPLREFNEQGIPLGYVHKEWNPFEVNELEKIGMKQSG